MRSTNFFDMLFQDPDRAIVGLLHQGAPGMLLTGAGLLAIFGVALAGQAYFRGAVRPSIRSVAQNVGGAAWLLPIAAVFALYLFWMRPSLTSPDETAPATIPVVAVKSPAVDTDSKLPDWAKESGHSLGGDTELVVVTGKFGATIDEAVAAGRAAAFERLQADFSAAHPQAASWEPPASITGDAIHRTFVEQLDKKTSTGTKITVYQAYEQVELSPAVRKKILPLWRNQIVEKRIWALGGLAGLLTLTFGTLAAYFRLDQRTSGLYRRRLKLAAVSVIAAGGMAAATML
jgi:hypothetical protein